MYMQTRLEKPEGKTRYHCTAHEAWHPKKSATPPSPPRQSLHLAYTYMYVHAPSTIHMHRKAHMHASSCSICRIAIAERHPTYMSLVPPVRSGTKVQNDHGVTRAQVVFTLRLPAFRGVHRACTQYIKQMQQACGLMHAPVNASAVGAALS